MIQIFLSGRLGNLILQHSLAFYFKQENVSVVFLAERLDGSNGMLNINPAKVFTEINRPLIKMIIETTFIENILIRIFRYRFIKTHNYTSIYYQGLFNSFKRRLLIKRDGILYGVWLNPKYHHKYKTAFSEVLFYEVSKTLVKPMITIGNSMTACVGVHVRRGDYLNLVSDGYIVLDNDYYKSAMRLMLQKLNNCKFFVFSDDIQWCKSNLNNPDFEIEFIENQSALEDYFCLLTIKNLIISNSTFSWTAAYFNKNIDNVIAPKKWFNDKRVSYKTICPAEWYFL